MSDRPVMPRWEPAWARRRSWLWGVLNGFVGGTILAGMARFLAELSADASVVVGLVGGLIQGVIAAVYVVRPHRQPKWAARVPILDVRNRDSRWIFALTPVLVLLFSLRWIVEGILDRRVWEVVWAVEFGAAVSALAHAQYRAVVQMQDEQARIAPEMIPPPVPPPSGPPPSGPPPLPGDSAR